MKGMNIKKSGIFSGGKGFNCYETDFVELFKDLETHVVSKRDKKRCVNLSNYKKIQNRKEFRRFFDRNPEQRYIPRKNIKCSLLFPVIFTYNNKFSRVDVHIKYDILNQDGFSIHAVGSSAITQDLRIQFASLKKGL